MAERITTVIFDFGGVVVDWDMRHLFRNEFDTEHAMESFLADVLTPAENLRCDLGEPLATVVAELIQRHPHHQKPLEAWRDRWIETIPRQIEGTAELVDQLKHAGYQVTGLSNFSAETFPWCRERYPIFEEFDDIVLSGEVGLAKPDPRMYLLACERGGFRPEQAIFIDDSLANVEGALNVGLHALHFKNAQDTTADLKVLGLHI